MTATIVIGVGGATTGYSPQAVSLERGGVLTVENTTTWLTRSPRRLSGPKATRSSTWSSRPTPPGNLVAAPDPGRRRVPFYCTFHPNMLGTLTVTGEPGGDVPTPPSSSRRCGSRGLKGSDITIHMRQADVRIMPHGPKTRMWTYGGSFPGPTIERPTGSLTRVTFVHDLPPHAGSLSVHQHGGHHSSADDGQPTRHLIDRGSRRTYTYPLVDAGRPMPAGFRFYHDHRMDRTARNNWRGLQGMFLVTDEREERLDLPSGSYDVSLHFSDRSFTASNQLTDPFPVRDAPVDDRSAGAARRRHGREADPGQRSVRAVPAGAARPLPPSPPERIPLLGV